jgi:hypothetical protein
MSTILTNSSAMTNGLVPVVNSDCSRTQLGPSCAQLQSWLPRPLASVSFTPWSYHLTGSHISQHSLLRWTDWPQRHVHHCCQISDPRYVWEPPLHLLCCGAHQPDSRLELEFNTISELQGTINMKEIFLLITYLSLCLKCYVTRSMGGLKAHIDTFWTPALHEVRDQLHLWKAQSWKMLSPICKEQKMWEIYRHCFKPYSDVLQYFSRGLHPLLYYTD